MSLEQVDFEEAAKRIQELIGSTEFLHEDAAISCFPESCDWLEALQMIIHICGIQEICVFRERLTPGYDCVIVSEYEVSCYNMPNAIWTEDMIESIIEHQAECVKSYG